MPSFVGSVHFEGNLFKNYCQNIFFAVNLIDLHERLLFSPFWIVREVNLTKEGDLLHHSESRMKGCTLLECWKVCIKKSEYEEKAKSNETFNSNSKEVK